MSTAGQKLVPDGGMAARDSSPPVRKAILGMLILILALFPLLQFSGASLNYWLHMLLFTFMYIALTSSWNIIGGYAGYISLGHNVFFAVGGYLAAILFLYFGISPFLTAPVAGLAAMAVALLVGLISLRTRGPSFIISTIALVLVTKIAIDNWEYVGGANGIACR